MMRCVLHRLKAIPTVAAALLLIAASSAPAKSVSTAAAAQQVPAEASRLHVILLANTNCPRIGENCGRDVDAVNEILETAFASVKGRIVFHTLVGDDWTPGRIEDYLRRLEVGPNENVFVYFSGHGSMVPGLPESTHALAINNGRLLRADLRRTLEQKSPRGLILLTDCCSGYGAGRDLSRSLVRAVRAGNVKTLRNLLLRLVGVVDVTAAENGTNAIADNVGYNPTSARSAFTVALLSLWSDPERSFESWEELFPVLRAKTWETSGQVHQAHAFEIREQRLAAQLVPAKAA